MNKHFKKILISVFFALALLSFNSLPAQAAQCLKNEILSSDYRIAPKRCMVQTETKFLFLDKKTGFMEPDPVGCRKDNWFVAVAKIVIPTIVSIKMNQSAVTTADYAATGAITIVTSDFVKMVTEGRLNKRCAIAAARADENNNTDRVGIEMRREALRNNKKSAELDAMAQAEESGQQVVLLQEQASTQQTSVSQPVPQAQNCGTPEEVFEKAANKAFSLKTDQKASTYLANATDPSTAYALMDKACAQAQMIFSMDSQCRVGCVVP